MKNVFVNLLNFCELFFFSNDFNSVDFINLRKNLRDVANFEIITIY